MAHGGRRNPKDPTMACTGNGARNKGELDMARTNVTAFDENEGRQIVGWFWPEKAAAEYREAERWNGNNMVGVHHGGYVHEVLYLTPGGRWVLHNWSQWQGSQPSYEFITDDAARLWLIANNDSDSDAAIEDHFGPLPDEFGPEVK